MELLQKPETYISFFTLAGMEIVLGIDNIVFITILTGKLPPERQHSARRLGIGLALISRLALLFALSWIMGLTKELFVLFEHAFTGKDLVLLCGGLFLIWKATVEIYENVEHPDHQGASEPSSKSDVFFWLMLQIIIMDIVFSLDSVITAVGMVKELPVMIAAMITAVVVMMVFAGPVGDFVQRHKSVKVLAMSFLVLIGVLLTAEGMGQHIPKGYLYFAMAYAMVIEMINMRMRKRTEVPASGQANAAQSSELSSESEAGAEPSAA